MIALPTDTTQLQVLHSFESTLTPPARTSIYEVISPRRRVYTAAIPSFQVGTKSHADSVEMEYTAELCMLRFPRRLLQRTNYQIS
ncbi:hypothetical protein T4A_2451, partial [Trichinella pseudospiralis]